MARIKTPEVALREVSGNDPRIGHLLGSGLRPGDVAQAILIGFPIDEGVRRNGGRVGASAGPDALRRALYHLTPDPGNATFDAVLRHTRDLGNLEVDADLEDGQRALGDVLAPFLDRGVFTIVLGGGHETSYGHFLGYARRGQSVDVLNWDAHTDVRELKDHHGHSGSPFRQMIEDPSACCRRYIVAGLQPHLVARSHLQFVQQHGRAIWRDEVTTEVIRDLYQESRKPTLVSFDLDAIRESEAPGVSAPNAAGLASELWLEAAYQAGRCSAVTSADVVELNPAVDRDDQTARLAAITVWRMLRGLADRA